MDVNQFLREAEAMGVRNYFNCLAEGFLYGLLAGFCGGALFAWGLLKWLA